jgi:succinate dehydrogenase / fumarate reductase, cytochrome b subunit
MSLDAPLRPRLRPLSPHLAIYRLTLTMMTSIAHRMTGAAFYFGTLILTWWLIAVASGLKPYHAFETYLVSPPGKFVLLCYSWALIHHLRLRHFAWDFGRDLELPIANMMERATLVGSIFCLFFPERGKCASACR